MIYTNPIDIESATVTFELCATPTHHFESYYRLDHPGDHDCKLMMVERRRFRKVTVKTTYRYVFCGRRLNLLPLDSPSLVMIHPYWISGVTAFPPKRPRLQTGAAGAAFDTIGLNSLTTRLSDRRTEEHAHRLLSQRREPDFEILQAPVDVLPR